MPPSLPPSSGCNRQRATASRRPASVARATWSRKSPTASTFSTSCLGADRSGSRGVAGCWQEGPTTTSPTRHSAGILRHADYTRRGRGPSPPRLKDYDSTEISMKRLALALGTLMLGLAVTPSANAVVQPPWVVVRWAYGDCKIWRNDVNAPAGPGWTSVAFAKTYPEAWAKMQALYAKRLCV